MSHPQDHLVERVLSVFSKETTYLIAEYPISSFNLTKFKEHFGIPSTSEDSEMVLEYEVFNKDVEFLVQYLPDRVEFNFEDYSYFLSCYRVSE